MSIERITPLMSRALDAGAKLLVFGDLWLSTLAKTIDKQEDLEAAVLSENIDTTTWPGQAVIERDTAFATPIISQATGAGTQSLARVKDLSVPTKYTSFDSEFTSIWQSFTPDVAGDFNNIILKVTNPSGSSRTITVNVYQANPDLSGPGRLFTRDALYGWYGSGAYYVQTSWSPDPEHYLLATRDIVVSGSYTGEITVSLTDIPFFANTKYWICAYSAISVANTPSMYYSATDVYPGGECYSVTEYKRNYYHVNMVDRVRGQTGIAEVLYSQSNALLGDMYFKVQVDGYKSRARFTSQRMVLDELPSNTGTFQLSAAIPTGTDLAVTLNAYNAEADTTPAWSMARIPDGQEIPPYLVWELDMTFLSDALYAYTPFFDSAEVLFPKDRLLLRPANVGLQFVDQSLKRDYQPLIGSAEVRGSELKMMERVSSGGTGTVVLTEPAPDKLPRLISDRPLKNYRLMLYVGADVEGFQASDLCRYFIGIVEKPAVKPRYGTESYEVTLEAKNPILDMKRKIPMAQAEGTVDLASLSIDRDGWHVVDSMYDDIRGKAAIPARYINAASFWTAKQNCGYDTLAAGALVIRRSNDGGLADTRVKSPEELSKLLAAQATILDGYVVEDEENRIKLVVHDPDAASEAAWADLSLVNEEGTSEIPIESVGGIVLGYDDWLANLVICGYGWDGSGSDWTAFAGVEASVNNDSAAEFTMSTSPYLSPMEKNMKEPSKWLGQENGYGGRSIARALTRTLAARFGFPPARLVGAVLPVSQYRRGLGSVVTVRSKEYARFGRKGIAASEAVKFMIIKRQLDQGRNKMIFDLVELT